MIVNAPAARVGGSDRPPGGTGSPKFGWVDWFVVFLIACQLGPLVGALAPYRMYFRVAAFAASLGLLLLVRGRGRRHPATAPAAWVLVILAVALFHPNTNTWTAALAQLAMYAAILAPLFWVPRLHVNLAGLRRVVIILWAFHSLSAGVGILQVYFPGRFQPQMSEVLGQLDGGYLSYLNAQGTRVLRPMGLTDVPGGAASAGFYAVLFGAGLLLTNRSVFKRALYVLSMNVGLVAIYLSQIRSLLVLTLLCVVALCCMLAIRGRTRDAFVLSGVLAATSIAGFLLAASVGGKSITDRVVSLIERSPVQVYAANRGIFLDYTLEELLPRYPLGAGLGRWGMMNSYFGDDSNPASEGLWAEIQWTAWLYDGGIPLIIAYVATLIVAIGVSWKLARSSTGELSQWAMLLLAYNVGIAALMFSYPVFLSDTGLGMWLLNGLVFAVALASSPEWRPGGLPAPRPRV